MNTTIDQELDVELTVSPDHSVAVATRLRYHSGDPFAVHLTFHDGSPAPVPWTFSRELLLDGLFAPAGHGDVRVWPAAAAAGGRVLCLALTSPEGDALLRAPMQPVARWLERTLRLVPPGAEEELLGLDEELWALRAGAADGPDEPGGA